MALGISSYKAGCQVFHLQLKVLIFKKNSYLIPKASHTDEALFLYICIDLAKENKPVYFQQQKIIKYLIYIINYLTCNMWQALFRYTCAYHIIMWYVSYNSTNGTGVFQF